MIPSMQATAGPLPSTQNPNPRLSWERITHIAKNSIYLIADFFKLLLCFGKDRVFQNACAHNHAYTVQCFQWIDINQVLGHKTPLSAAAENGHWEMVQYLLSRGADLNLPKERLRKSPLAIAAEQQNEKMVCWLLERGADRENAFLQVFPHAGSLTLLEHLEAEQLQKLEKSQDIPFLSQMIHKLERTSKLAAEEELLVAALIEKGCDLKMPLSLALALCSAEHCQKVLGWLVTEQNINTLRNHWGTLLLHAAVNCEHAKTIVPYLLSFPGIEVDIRDLGGKTPLITACNVQAPEEVVTALLKKGASSTAIDKQGMSPLIYAYLRKNQKIINLLHRNGASLNTPDETGKTPFMKMCSSSYAVYILSLCDYLQNDSPVLLSNLWHQRDSKNETAVHSLMRCGSCTPKISSYLQKEIFDPQEQEDLLVMALGSNELCMPGLQELVRSGWGIQDGSLSERVLRAAKEKHHKHLQSAYADWKISQGKP